MISGTFETEPGPSTGPADMVEIEHSAGALRPVRAFEPPQVASCHPVASRTNPMWRPLPLVAAVPVVCSAASVCRKGSAPRRSFPDRTFRPQGRSPSVVPSDGHGFAFFLQPSLTFAGSSRSMLRRHEHASMPAVRVRLFSLGSADAACSGSRFRPRIRAGMVIS